MYKNVVTARQQRFELLNTQKKTDKIHDV